MKDVVLKCIWMLPSLKDYNHTYEDINILFFDSNKILVYDLNRHYNQHCVEILLKMTQLNYSTNDISDDKHTYLCSIFRTPNDSLAGYIVLKFGRKISELLMKVFMQLLSNQLMLLLRSEKLNLYSWIHDIDINKDIANLLSDKEKQVLISLVSGKTDDEITTELSISKSTVRTHIRNIYDKMGVSNRSEAISKYFINTIEYREEKII